MAVDPKTAPSDWHERTNGFAGPGAAAAGPLAGAASPAWDVERMVSLLAGSFTLFSLAMGRFHHRRWRMMTALIGSNLILQAVAGWCPASLMLRRLGVPTRDSGR